METSYYGLGLGLLANLNDFMLKQPLYHLPVYRLPTGDLCVTRVHVRYAFDHKLGVWVESNEETWGGEDKEKRCEWLVTDVLVSSNSRFDFGDYGFVKKDTNEWSGAPMAFPFEEANPFAPEIIEFTNWLRGMHKVVSVYDFIPLNNGDNVKIRTLDSHYPPAHLENIWYFDWAIKLGIFDNKFLRQGRWGLVNLLDNIYMLKSHGHDDGSICAYARKTFWDYVYQSVIDKKQIEERELLIWEDWLQKVALSSNLLHMDYRGVHLAPPISQPKQLRLF